MTADRRDSRSLFEGNTAGSPGAIFIGADSVMTIARTTIIQVNRANGDGGGIFNTRRDNDNRQYFQL